MTTRDETMPQGKWSFDQSVTDAFDDMLERSIPAYNTMRDLTRSLAETFVVPGTDVVDLGCSRGQAVEPLVKANGRLDASTFYLCDVSEPMLSAARSRFKSEIESGVVKVENLDLRTGYPDVAASVTLCVLTLQFTPIEYRWGILQSIFDHTVPGGALLLVEKVLGGSASLHDRFDREYLAFKGRSGYTPEQITRKKASLEGVLVSLSARENERMLRDVGFSAVDTYYRWLNFAGWVAVR